MYSSHHSETALNFNEELESKNQVISEAFLSRKSYLNFIFSTGATTFDCRTRGNDLSGMYSNFDERRKQGNELTEA